PGNEWPRLVGTHLDRPRHMSKTKTQCVPIHLSGTYRPLDKSTIAFVNVTIGRERQQIKNTS
ncbi:MAG: hypothetical protein MIO92_01695, partial [Methanosarcinaceae archaeon]|nr:hypothetical protein [Methanosarcinaceae archaeon]